MCESGHYMHRDPATAPGEARTPRRVRVTWRHRGGRKPEGVVYVGRPTRWGNPYPVTVYGLAESLRRFRDHLRARPDLVADAREALAGYDLACYCPKGQPCHADEWLTLVNTSKD